jgi:hypothetical protein
MKEVRSSKNNYAAQSSMRLLESTIKTLGDELFAKKRADKAAMRQWIIDIDNSLERNPICFGLNVRKSGYWNSLRNETLSVCGLSGI